MSGALDDVGVVVVTYNSRDDVGRALSALPVADLAGVVVVDNASTDGTPELVEGLGIAGLRIVRQANRGFGAGCNAGAAALPGCRRLLYLNPDAVIEREHLQRLVRHLDEHPRAAVVAPRLYTDGEPLSPGGAVARTRHELRYVLPHRIGRLLPERRLPATYDRSGPVGVVEGACMLTDAQQVAAAGGFDERYFLFFEEHDLARRLATDGKEMHLCADARAEHGVGASRVDLPMQGRAPYVESAVRYLRQWRGGVRAGVYCLGAVPTWRYARARGLLTKDDVRELRSALRAGWREVRR